MSLAKLTICHFIVADGQFGVMLGFSTVLSSIGKDLTMSEKVSTNKQGQSLGRKGLATRERLLKAAERLLKTRSPLDLTAVAIAKEAQTSCATFYMYFDDVKDAFFSLSEVAGDDVVAKMESFDSDPAEVGYERAATEMVLAFSEVWNKHRHILRYRNLEADRGDSRFEKHRMNAYIREVSVLSKWIQASGSDDDKPSLGDSFALATVLHAALERLASLDPHIVDDGIGMPRFVAAQARIIAQVLADTPKWGRLPIGK